MCLAESRYVERRIPFLDLPGRVRQAKAMTDAGDERGWTPVDDGPVFRYLRWIREEGEQRMVPPDLRLRTVYLIELVCPPDRSVVVAQEGLRGRLEDIASNAVANARVSRRWQVGPTEPIYVKRIEYDLDEGTRTELCARVAATTSLPKADVAAAAGALFSAIADALARRETVTVAGFGKFTTRDRPARTGRNPQTGEAVAIAASRAPAFKAGKALRDAVNV